MHIYAGVPFQKLLFLKSFVIPILTHNTTFRQFLSAETENCNCNWNYNCVTEVQVRNRDGSRQEESEVHSGDASR